MINLMYIVLTAMLALNVSSDVLDGFTQVHQGLNRSNTNVSGRNDAIYNRLAAFAKENPGKGQVWFDRATEVRQQTNSLYGLIDSLKLAIVQKADGPEGNPDNLIARDDLEAAAVVMLNPANRRGEYLRKRVDEYRKYVTSFTDDPKKKASIEAALSTDPILRAGQLTPSKWEDAKFDQQPAIAAVTMLSKLQSDVRKAEGEVLHTLRANIDLKDIRVNELNAYVSAEATTLYPGETFRSRIFMAAVDTTQRPEIYVNGRRIAADGHYNFTAGSPGEYSFSGYILMQNATGETMRRPFTQKYNVIAPPQGATVAADLMNVLYAGFDNPISVSASGIPHDKIHLTMNGGTLTARGTGKYVARPGKVGSPVTFTVTGTVNGRTQTMGSYTFQVRKLPDPKAYLRVGGERHPGGRVAKATLLASPGLAAAIDDGLLNIPFRVNSFETVFADRMGNLRPEPSAGPDFTEKQRNLMRELRRGQRFYISNVRATGPDGITRTLSGAVEVIVN